MAAKRGLLIAVIAAVVTILVLGAAYAGPPKPCAGGLLKVAQNAWAPNLDVHATSATATREIAMNIFETLVTYNENYAIVPMLATKWEIAPDGLSYTSAAARPVAGKSSSRSPDYASLHAMPTPWGPR